MRLKGMGFMGCGKGITVRKIFNRLPAFRSALQIYGVSDCVEHQSRIENYSGTFKKITP
jgi:uncharacterized protein Usg